MTQLATDNELEAHVRERKNVYEETGVPATRDQLKADAQAYAQDRGIDPDTVDIGETVERAFNPGPASDPEAVGEYTQNVFKNYVPPPPEEKAEIRRMLENPPEKPFAAPAKPDGPPPKDALTAYERHCDTFKWVEENLGVAPHHVLGILKTETNLGSYTGNHNVLDVLHETAALGGKKKKSADRNIAALMRLGQQKRLGRRGSEDITGSYAGAFGIAQFMPASWEAYSRDRKGKGDDPFNYEDAIVSAANYLKIHGYDQNVKKSFHAYNHSDAYVEKVNNTAERIKPGLDGLKGPCR
jgi:membrane-bound lytic murein transglycosylase B